MKRKPGMTDLELLSLVALAFSWIIYFLLFPMMGENDAHPDNTVMCTSVVLLVSIFSIAALWREKVKKNTPALIICPVDFPKDEMKDTRPVEIECLAHFKANDIVHVTELSPLLELTPPTLDELLRKSYSDEKLTVRYDAEMESFIIPEGYILYITKDRKIKFGDDYGKTQLVTNVMYVNRPLGMPIVKYIKGKSFDIETMPKHPNLPLMQFEISLIDKIDRGQLDAEYDPNTQLLTIKSGGIFMDNNGNMRIIRVSEAKLPLKIVIVEPDTNIDKDQKKQVELEARTCPECKREIHGPGEFCPNCGTIL